MHIKKGARDSHSVSLELHKKKNVPGMQSAEKQNGNQTMYSVLYVVEKKERKEAVQFFKNSFSKERRKCVCSSKVLIEKASLSPFSCVCVLQLSHRAYDEKGVFGRLGSTRKICSKIGVAHTHT